MRVHQAYKTVKEKSEASHDRAVQLRERGVRNADVNVGDIVLLQNPTNQPEAEAQWPTQWIGPYRIVEKTKTNATIRALYTGRVESVHLSRLKIAHLRGEAFPIDPGGERGNTVEISVRPKAGAETSGEPGTGVQSSGESYAHRYNLRARAR
jgi:hypothetical protein